MQHDKFYNNISCELIGFRKKREKNLLSTFMLTPPQQFLLRSLAIIPQSNFWCDSGTVSKIIGHTFSVETNFFSLSPGRSISINGQNE